MTKASVILIHRDMHTSNQVLGKRKVWLLGYYYTPKKTLAKEETISSESSRLFLCTNLWDYYCVTIAAKGTCKVLPCWVPSGRASWQPLVAHLFFKFCRQLDMSFLPPPHSGYWKPWIPQTPFPKGRCYCSKTKVPPFVKAQPSSRAEGEAARRRKG